MDQSDESEFDPEIAAKIVRLLSELDELQRRRIAAARQGPASGSPAAADAGLPDSRFVWMYADQAISSALDHLLAWSLLFRGGRIPIMAHLTLLRGALEGAVRARWLVNRRARPGVRVGRGYATRHDDQEQRDKWEKAKARNGEAPERAPGGYSAEERLAQLDDPDEINRRQKAGVRSVGFADPTSLTMTYRLESWYRLASGAAHGKEWVYAKTDLRPAAEAAAPGVGQGMMGASDQVALDLTSAAVRAVRKAVEDLEAYKMAPATAPRRAAHLRDRRR